MKTIYLKVNADSLDDKVIEQAALIIKQGDLVAFPTDTVYGLGADALNETAVQKIFAAKGRPQDNPLILLVSSWEQACDYVRDIPDEAHALVEKFWPGPLTLVLPARETVPDIIRAGLAQVGVRMPSHKAALALIEKAGVPLAAPSANVSGRPSPTSAEHVKYDLDGRIAAILDGGSTRLGIESTLLDMTSQPYRILRSGAITIEDLEQSIPGKVIKADNEAPAAKLAHYQPRVKIIPFASNDEMSESMARRYGAKLGLVTLSEPTVFPNVEWHLVISGGVSEYGQRLFDIFRTADQHQIEYLFMELPESKELGQAVADRIKQAAGS
ncbi:MAG: L-threonylcarbamoyladenylate synthase [Acidobacteriota bacterium]